MVHVGTGILAMREVRHDVKCYIDNKTGLVIMASYECQQELVGNVITSPRG